MAKRFSALILAPAILGACSHDVVRTRWAADSVPLRETVRPTLSISSTPAEPTAATRWRDLPERSGAAFAEALSRQITDPKQYVATLAEPIAPRATLNRNRTQLSRVIAIDVSPSGYDPVDRLARTQVTIVPMNFRFAGYTLAQTEYQTIDLETITSSRTQSASITLSPSLGNTIEAVEATASDSQTDQTVYTNRARIRDLSVGFSPRRVTVTRDGGPGLNLWGNTILKATARPASETDALYETLVTGFKITDDTNGNDLAPANATVTLSLDTIWQPAPLYVCAQLSTVTRHVFSGPEFFDEGRQAIRETTATDDARVYELVPQEDVETPRFGLLHSSGSHALIDTPTGVRPLTFTSALDATTVVEWLARSRADRIGIRALWVLDSRTGARVRLGGAENGRLQVERLRTGSTAAGITAGRRCDLQTGTVLGSRGGDSQ